MDLERPSYIPGPVWRCWIERRDAPWFDSPAMRRGGARLLGLDPAGERDRLGTPLIARAWNRLGKVRRTDQDWALIFDTLWTLPEALDRDARDALAECRALSGRIAETAGELAHLLAAYAERAERHGITSPPEALLPEALARAAAALSYQARDPAPGELPQDLPELGAFAAAIGRAFEDWAPGCTGLGGDHANAPQASAFAQWVRLFDARLYRLNKSLSLPLTVGDEDAARLLSAALGLTFSRELVQRVRNPPRKK